MDMCVHFFMIFYSRTEGQIMKEKLAFILCTPETIFF